MKLDSLILLENEDFIVLNKPSGLLSIPDREGKEISLKMMLKEKYGNIFTVHRLDKDTSGIIVFAKNEASHKHLSLQFEERKTKKVYHGLVIGSPAEKSGHIDAPLAEHPGKKGTMMVHRKGKETLTDYEVIQEFGIYTWVQFHIHTGRMHQIRVHAREIGHPLVNDPLYGDGKPVLLSSLKHKKFKLSKDVLEERPLLNRLALHASQLSFSTQGGDLITIDAPLQKDMKALLQQLSKWKGKK